jgi:hypothetical protein
MYPVLTQVRRNVEDVVNRLFREIPNIRIGVITHGCAHDGPPRYQDLTDNRNSLIDFIRNVPATGGGGAHASYELVLQKVRSFAWTLGKSRALIMIGDEPPHEPHGLFGRRAETGDDIPNWREQLDALARDSVHVYGVQALNNSYAEDFYHALAQVSGGAYMRLNQFASAVDFILAIAFRQISPERLKTFEEEVVREGRFDRSYDEMFSALDPTRARKVAKKLGLTPVPNGRFQIIDVPAQNEIERLNRAGKTALADRITIMELVESLGIPFKEGNGFYEFNKREEIQWYKEVVVQDRTTGDLYSGDAARDMVALPKSSSHVNATIKPEKFGEWRVFVQSTSNNRILARFDKGFQLPSKFLYDVSGDYNLPINGPPQGVSAADFYGSKSKGTKKKPTTKAKKPKAPPVAVTHPSSGLGQRTKAKATRGNTSRTTKKVGTRSR